MSLVNIIKNTFLYSFFIKSSFGKNYYIKKGTILNRLDLEKKINLAPSLLLNNPIKKKLKVGIVKDNPLNFNIEGYVHKNSSWVFYERYLKNNKIDYVFYDIYRNDWLEVAKELDIIVWHTNSNPSEMYMAESKLYVLEKILEKVCFPSFHEIWQYEDKNRSQFLYESLELPYINTFISNSYEDSLAFVENTEYPIIYKNYIGSASKGVHKIENKKHAERLITRIFSYKGAKSVFKYIRQKDNVFFQKFISDASYDLRIMIIGNKAFGYYRYPKKNDFKASGSGIYEKKEIPREALILANEIKNKLNSRLMGIDLLFSPKSNRYQIIETSLFNQIDTPEQLVINGISGYYDLSTDDFLFKEGRFWMHELVMELLINNYINKQC